MAKYLITKQSDGTYSLMATLLAGTDVVHRVTEVNIKRRDVGKAIERAAKVVGTKRPRGQSTG